MRQSYTGLNSVKRSIEGTLKNPNLNAQTRIYLEGKLSETNSWMTRIEDLFKPFGGIQ
ncbi:TPA: hypothetical protein RY498_003643 [Escherichia albertii]|nr:hypothetical protein [Escherichia albertii]